MAEAAATQAPPLVPLGELFERGGREFAERQAVVDPYRALTYGELDERARRLAAALFDLGTKPGDRIMLAASNRCEWLMAERAMALSGLVRVHLIPRLHPRELAHIANDCEPFAILLESEWLAGAGLDWLPEGVRATIAIGPTEKLPESVIGFRDLVGAASVRELPAPRPDDLAALWYTSGSTGLPKGVLCTHRTFGASTRNILTVMPLEAGDVALHTAPISHWSGAIGLALSAVGGCNRMRAGFDPGDVLEQVEAHGVTVLPLVPTQINRLIDAVDPEEARERMASVRLVPYAGSAIAPDRLERALEVFPESLAQFYGSAESPAPMTYLSPREHAAADRERLLSAGRTYPLTDIRILDADPETGVGEIAARGEQVTSGYWRRPEATAEIRDEEGFLRTGDLGRLDEEGYLYIVDRKKEMIVTGGFNVYPREVENVVSAIPGVAEVAVVGAPDERWGEAITALVVREAGVALDAEAVIGACREQIAGYKVPKRVEFVEALPKSGSGKVLKRELRERYWRGRERRV